MTSLSGLSIRITGIVQGVGFRPFVYGLASRLSLTGWVRNTSAGVDIEADGDPMVLEQFLSSLKAEPPPLARIDSFKVQSRPPNGFSGFAIIHSVGDSRGFIPISPDVSICDDCLREMNDPADRRFQYPFINCTNCGPRFTIIKDVPYDRLKTTMASFEMCAACRAEYEEPLDRRFHAQPVACRECGPRIWLEFPGELAPDPPPDSWRVLEDVQRMLALGRILAIKGLGGFHLACDAANKAAVQELRRRKLRADKPFALMMPDIETVAKNCFLNDAERDLLVSRKRPIVVLQKRADSPIAEAVAPGQGTLGVMLPYTPLHTLLFKTNRETPLRPDAALVMTSGNLSEEPIATGNDEARERLNALADAFLMHDRDIQTRCDDSVLRVFSPFQTAAKRGGRPIPLRRSRGYAPDPIQLPWELAPVLGVGAELKNTFCLTRERYAFLSHHIGDLENYETLRAFEEGIRHYERLFRVRPEAVAYDLHPDYLATRYARKRAEAEGLAAVGIQHHHAHIAACMAEHGLQAGRRVIGVAFDGAGYGDDGAIWGGEILLANYCDYQRAFHLAYVPLPGGDKSVREPWRMALAWLRYAGLEWADDLPPVRFAHRSPRAVQNPLQILRVQLEKRVNAPPTSSVGRLFDAVSALLGVRETVSYEAQAAIELEALADPDEAGVYPVELKDGIIHPAPMLHDLVDDYRAGIPVSALAARFHNSLAHMVHDVCLQVRADTGVNAVVLSGGVWQNMTLFAKTIPLLEEDHFKVCIHEQTPPNDGGLALGQAVAAHHRLLSGKM